ncbi:unnamed protein product [Orchesella dallaii]|uniref:Alkyl transferase n=1 Tax=Orchesella dallaii TaxID=48710 RepID=A0ABP1RM04_9HEXA
MEPNLKIEESFLQKLFRITLQQGSIPKHIAFVLDGNRRYAKERDMKTIGGHRKGYSIDWAMLCGVQEVTAFVFSINNFDRAASEVQGVMSLFKEKIEHKLVHPEELEGKCYQFIGNWSLVPQDLKPVISKLITVTKHNKTIVINIALAYTGRDEITSGVNSLLQCTRHNGIDLDTLNESLFEKYFHDFPVSSVDLLIRTGESRLSDFVTWESSDQAVLCFCDETTERTGSSESVEFLDEFPPLPPPTEKRPTPPIPPP